MTKLSEMTDFQINKRVFNILNDVGWYKNRNVGIFDYCNNWSDAGPIIVEHRINIEWHEWKNGIFRPYALNNETMKSCYDTNPLRAAMIVFLEMQ